MKVKGVETAAEAELDAVAPSEAEALFQTTLEPVTIEHVAEQQPK